MTLKELRTSKGLTQGECAAYLGMTVRNYQNYESSPPKEGTVRYNAIYQKIESYETNIPSGTSTAKAEEYNTNVIKGEALQAMTHTVIKYQKRGCFEKLQRFIKKGFDGRIAVLYGLRRTGKTTLLFQMINVLPVNQTAYIKIRTTDNMSNLTKDLEKLYENGYRYLFIDEVTLMDDFINTAALLSDIFAMMGMKIVVSGTDSLGFAMANRDELYDRAYTIHTSFIPFREYSRLLGISSVDTYIEYGGTLRMENIDFDDPDYSSEDVSFLDDESTRKYIDTAISRNIQHTLKNDRYGEYFNQLRELYDKGELTNVINRIIESMNHQFLLRVVQDEFKSHDLGSAKELLLHEYPSDTAHVLYDIDEKTVIERLKSIIDVKERRETTVTITEEHLQKVKKYLFMLDLLTDCTECYESRGRAGLTLFNQPGMRYSIAKALVYSLMQDEYFSTRPEEDKTHIKEKILEDVKGRMMEDIVLLETSKALRSSKDVFKFKFDDGGEYDMVTYDKQTNSCRIYEVKHSDKIVPQQTRYLKNETKLKTVSYRFGRIEGRYVIYSGPDQVVDDIHYLNVEEYLNSLG